jgi:hypothetical protein
MADNLEDRRIIARRSAQLDASPSSNSTPPERSIAVALRKNVPPSLE